MAWKCKDCKQLIAIKNNLIVNAEGGEGGFKGDRHVCKHRLESGSIAENVLSKKDIICNRCGLKYKGEYVSCPDCFALKCQDCATVYYWLRSRKKAGCPKCGSLYADNIELSVYNSQRKCYEKLL
ncbi:MAG TPA: hypothetical protein VL854_03415 [Nitrososphaeraceae archaeon]|nr:hypothetical protein [Nitrososphaeraceae archaeon]